MKLLLEFGECEHRGDLQRYVEQLRGLGAKIVSAGQSVHEYETGQIVVEVPDRAAFNKILRATPLRHFGGIVREVSA